jgi:hypothetical protein
MQCKEAQDWIRGERRFADGLADHDQAALEQHVSACPACQVYRERERAFDAALRPVLLDVEVPVALPERIQWALRRDRRARQRAWSLYGAVAAAAVLIGALGVGWYVNRPYDLMAMHAATEWLENEQMLAQDSDLREREGLARWLQQHGVSGEVPSKLRVQHLIRAYLVKIEGRTVPLLELREGNSISRVFLLDRRYFSESQQFKLYSKQNVMSYVIADDPESSRIGWMIVDQGNPQQFVDGELPANRW